MMHLGDITQISGYAVPPVDVVIGGSPGQDLSVVGKRAGLAGARSVLFMEQIRLIKELRNADIQRGRADVFIRPRFMLWENVPGAFSSNKGNDFRAVFEETIKIAEPDAPDVPLPEKGKWPLADCWYGDGWSVAYRVLDAQFWGVPSAGVESRLSQILEDTPHPKYSLSAKACGVCGDTAESGAAGKETAAGTGSGTYPAIARSLTARYDGSPCIDRGPDIVWCLQGNGIDRADTAGCNGRGWKAGVSYTLNTIDRHAVYQTASDHQSQMTDYTAIVMATGQAGAEITRDMGPTLNCNHEQPIISHGATGIVRRLAPLECERLQGYPDGWTDIGPWTDGKGKLHKESSDSARYKALGNSIALPPWVWVLKRLYRCYERPATMASLFDGIGGFPLIWERLNGPGNCLWASEIEEFPIAVTKRRFGGEHGNRPA